MPAACERRAAAARLPRQRPLGAYQRAGGRQDQLGAVAAEGDQRDLVAAYVALGEDQLDCALDLGEPMQRRRARRVDDEEGERLALLLVSGDAKVLAADEDTVGGDRCRGAAQALPGCGGAQRLDDGEAHAMARRAAPHAGGAAALGRGARHAGPAGRRARARRSERQRGEEVGRDRGACGLDDEVGEILRARLCARLLRRVVRRRLGRRFVRLILLLALRRRRQLRRARRDHQRGGKLEVLGRDGVVSGERGRRLGGAQGEGGDGATIAKIG